MPQTVFPRQPGSEAVVREEDWNQTAEFGFCPACGSVGIEELHDPSEDAMCFYCSDSACKTIQDGRDLPARTKWNQEKPEEVHQKERSEWSWNQEHFPGQEFPLVCVD